MAEGYDPSYVRDNPDYYDMFNDGYENIEMQNLDPDDWEKKDGFLIPPEEETPFIDNLPEIPDTPGSLAEQEKIKSFYKYLEDNGYKIDKKSTS